LKSQRNDFKRNGNKLAKAAGATRKSRLDSPQGLTVQPQKGHCKIKNIRKFLYAALFSFKKQRTTLQGQSADF
jgi:hypothetical protein